MSSAFQKGDVIEYAGELYEVIENYGNSGRVRHPNDTSGESMLFYWTFGGESCRKVDATEQAADSGEEGVAKDDGSR